ncbi:MAG TPA: hypothetical protein VM431_09785 [Phycisphaerae bacterium]|nr:hypothetical protein [Phycisphaerae bacterium]
MKRYLVPMSVVTALLVAGAVWGLAGAQEQAKIADVLIIHGGGTPCENMGKFTPENVDAVSCPTPPGMNCAKAANLVAEALRAKQLSVTVVPADAITHRRDILAHRCVVLASPSYFGNASWKMHKLFHEAFWQVHALGGECLDGRRFALLATGIHENRCQQTLAAMEDVVKSCQGTPGPTAVVLINQTADETKAAAAKFADEIAGKLTEGK